MRRRAWRVLTDGSELWVGLRRLRWQYWGIRNRWRGEQRERWQRRWARTLRIRASGIGMRMRVMSRVVVLSMVVRVARGVRIAQNDVKAPVDGCQHEACRHQRTQAEHRNHEWRSPVGCAAASQSPLAPLDHRCTMPQ